MVNNFFTTLYDFTASSSADGIIVNWFNTGFNGAAPMWVGNALLIILSLIAATLFGGLVGFQREINGHAAGFRTHILISLGSALIMILSIYGISGEASRDPMRLAAAGVTGIGFLGAGSIIQNGFNVKGLTTAASMWVTMALGMCAGAGYFVIGTITTLITFLCLGAFRKVENVASRKNSNVLLIVDSSLPVLSMVLEISERCEVTIKDISSSLVKQDGNSYLRVVFKLSSLDTKAINFFLDELKRELKPAELKVLN